MGPMLYTIVEIVTGADFGVITGRSWFYLSFYLMHCGPAIGGFVVVGQMMKEYGTCYSIS
jgi:hypothetical protein